ncbi:MAG: nucleotide pyrophosphohydrolase [Pirellulales bacterium]
MPETRAQDDQTTLAELRHVVETFVAERQWQCFHTPKNLATSVAIEAGELMEHFQWLTPEESLQLRESPEKIATIAEELSDVMAYLLSLANALEIDVASSFVAKMEKNRQKYPAPSE